jgi:hypothetical protein
VSTLARMLAAVAELLRNLTAEHDSPHSRLRPTLTRSRAVGNGVAHFGPGAASRKRTTVAVYGFETPR